MPSETPLTILHVTHEAVHHMGGIGTVLEGLLTSPEYRRRVRRSLLIAPLWDADSTTDASQRLGGNGAAVYYSGLDGVDEGGFGDRLRAVEDAWGVKIVYGQRIWHDLEDPSRDAPAEALLIDLRSVKRERVGAVKALLWEKTGLESDRFEHNADYEQWCALAGPALDAALALLPEDELPAVVVSHEYMGVCTALLAAQDERGRFRTAFHAHECATARPIVERHPAHDAAFYPAMRRALENDRFVDDVFGDQSHNYRHELVRRAHHMDVSLAVGAPTRDELRFLSRAMHGSRVELCWNGAPSAAVSPEAKLHSRRRVLDWVERVAGFRPDLLFTHVTRPVVSKGLWRDLAMCAQLEPMLRAQGRRAVYMLLTCGAPVRSFEHVERMAGEYGWPREHREGWPDLAGEETHLWNDMRAFNAASGDGGEGGDAPTILAMLVNQWGFTRDALGPAAPQDMSVVDLRCASDVEFGMSVYEPFGIAPVEPLHAGAIAVVSSVSGCAGFAAQAMRELDLCERECPNMMVVDFTRSDAPDPVALSRSELHAIEQRALASAAGVLFSRLPRNDNDRIRLLETGQAIAARMGWDRVAQEMFIPALRATLHRPEAADRWARQTASAARP